MQQKNRALCFCGHYRIAPKLAGLGLKKYFHFGPVRGLKEEGYIDRLYK